MIWKVIGQSVVGSSHVLVDKPCEDAINYRTIPLKDGDEILVGFVSDGAGSAKYAAQASKTAVQIGVDLVNQMINAHILVNDRSVLLLAENIFDNLKKQAEVLGVAPNEFSCTLLGFVIFPNKACFIQIGDGAIIRNDGSGYFTWVWWPHNGEYQNTTAFLIDDPNFGNLKTRVIEERINEIAVFSDGLQMLALKYETETVHQPFFADLFKWLRLAKEEEHIAILDKKLADYLGSDTINNRTDDDKTLLLATRL